jgi:hypothetical protein
MDNHINRNDIKENINKEYKKITNEYWKFLNYGWPTIHKKVNHTRKKSSINNYLEIKTEVMNKLGIIPTYFFLTILFGDKDYPGPYNNIEKGLLILYFIIKNIPFEDMNKYISKSTFHDIYRNFYTEERISKLNKIIDYSLANMFSNINIRIMNGLSNNPTLFNQVTLHIDGHDTKGIVYGAKDKSIYYSYKLKRNGFRTQVAIDNNGFVIFVSKSQPCSIGNDGTMLTDMNIYSKVNEMDCIALDGGYTLFVNNIISNSNLNNHNFVFPIRKDLGINLKETELNYNDQFGGFRSKMEKNFANIGHIFERLNNTKSFITTDINIFNIQMKIASVLLNIKNYIELNKIDIFDFHAYWLNDEFDFEYNDILLDNLNTIKITQPKISERINNLDKMRLLQQQFIGLQTQNNVHVSQGFNEADNMDMELNNDNNILEDFEVEDILDHKGLVIEDSIYLVKWKNYPDSENQWLHYSRFNEHKIILDYWKK